MYFMLSSNTYFQQIICEKFSWFFSLVNVAFSTVFFPVALLSTFIVFSLQFMTVFTSSEVLCQRNWLQILVARGFYD